MGMRRTIGLALRTIVAMVSAALVLLVADAAQAAPGTITTVAGTSAPGYGGFLIADESNSVIRRVSPVGTITTMAGIGTFGYSGDGGNAIAAELHFPSGVAPTADGGFLIADTQNSVIRRVSAAGKITT